MLECPGLQAQGGVHRLEHGEDSVLGKPFPGKGVGRGELNVRLPLRPYVGAIIRGVALANQSNRCGAEGVIHKEGHEGRDMVHP